MVHNRTQMLVATDRALAVVTRHNGHWKAAVQLVGRPTQCVAVDPLRPQCAYCGMFGEGLWRSDDAGASWRPVGGGITYAEITSVAVSPLERAGDEGVVWAGTEPSALFRSEDGGATWQERSTLRELPSAPTWSFPPRPWTSHVRWITPDPNAAERLFVGIELGGVMRSLDAGLTWEDRKPVSQHDAHTLAMHRGAPGRVYEAAGGGYAESLDAGATWRRDDAGLTRCYVWGLAVDPANPEVVVVSAAPGPQQAHDERFADAAIYRRAGEGPWQEVREGLPDPAGTRAYVLAANDAEPGIFYAASRDSGIYRSPDAGLSWERLDITWPDGFHVAEVRGLVVADE